MSASTPSTIYLHDYSPAPYLIDRVDLRFEIHNDYTEVHSRLVIKRHEMAQPETPLVLTGQEMELLQVKLDGEPLAPEQYLLDDTSLTLPQLADSCIVEIVTRLQPQLNTSLMGLYASNGNLFTQCEAEGCIVEIVTRLLPTSRSFRSCCRMAIWWGRAVSTSSVTG